MSFPLGRVYCIMGHIRRKARCASTTEKGRHIRRSGRLWHTVPRMGAIRRVQELQMLNMKATIQRITVEEGRRVIAISDMHGHATFLKKLLEKVNFCADDVLVILGDMVERGHENLAAVRTVMVLKEKYSVYPLIGNVDEWAFSKVFSYDVEKILEDVDWFKRHHGNCLLNEMAEEMGMTIHRGMDVPAFREAIQRHFAPEYAFMSALPTLLDTNIALFVHGGIPEGPLEVFEGRTSREFTKRDAYISEGVHHDRYVVVGHWPCCLYADGIMQFSPVINEKQRIISIDGGCGIKRPEGQLNALILEGGKISHASYDELPVKTARDAQAPSLAPHSITYMNGSIEMIEEKGDVARVRHLPGGQEMWVPRERVFEARSQARCNDISDYHLPVSPGDALSVVFETSIGTVCKKDGVLGWYFGRLSERGR